MEENQESKNQYIECLIDFWRGFQENSIEKD